MGHDMERAEDEYWGSWAKHTTRSAADIRKDRARKEREEIAAALEARTINDRRAKLTGRLRNVLEGADDPFATDEPEATMEDLERIGAYVTRRIEELKEAARYPAQPDPFMSDPCVVTFSRELAGREFSYAALRIPDGPNAGLWAVTGATVKALGWKELVDTMRPSKGGPVTITLMRTGEVLS